MIESEFVFRGNLAETPLPEILATIHRHGVPGVMVSSGADETLNLYFVDGDVFLGFTFCEIVTQFFSPGRPRDG